MHPTVFTSGLLSFVKQIPTLVFIRVLLFRVFQSASQAVAGLIWGVLADRTSRVQLLSLGCAMWGVVSIFLGNATAFWQFALLKVLNGITMAR